METNRIKWDESMLMRFFAAYSDVIPKTSKPEVTAVIKKSEAVPEYLSGPAGYVEASADSEWKDFANDIDWAMM